MSPSAPDVRRQRTWLALILGLGALAQILIALESWRSDPFVRVPINDARVYWDWAGAIARGELVGSTPFLSAPLYPYVIGLVRALGGGIGAVIALQIALHIATAWLIALVARRRLGQGAALASAALYLLLGDPAYFPARMLNCTLQAFVVVLLWERLLAFAQCPDTRHGTTLGGVLGVNVLANPVLLFAVPFVALWAWSRERKHAAPALALAVSALLLTALATLHNKLASGEFIPVSAQAGVTFVHGNAPGADGTYHAIEGVSSDRIQQNLDARELVRASTDGSWSQTSSAFFAQGFAFWRSDPLGALALGARKLWWFLSGQVYGDIYVPELEIESGLASSLRLAPLAVAWWTFPALAALFLLWRQRKIGFPELLLFGVPFATVALFWYSPRYRLPAVPLIAMFGAWAAIELVSRRPLILAVAFALSIAAVLLNASVGFDAIDRYRAAHELSLGNVVAELGRFDEAMTHYSAAEKAGEPKALASIGEILRRQQELERALEVLTRAVRETPRLAFAHKTYAITLAQSGRPAEAEREFEAALALDPRDVESLSGLGNVHLAQGRADEAIARYQSALLLRPAFAAARFNLGLALEHAGRPAQAQAAWRAALASDPLLAERLLEHAESLGLRGEFTSAIASLRAGLAALPTQRDLASAAAWLLASAPRASDRDPAAALVLVRAVPGHASDPALLDIEGAALAATGDFAGARALADTAIERFVALGAPAEVLEQVRARLALYTQQKAFVQTPP